MNAVEIDLNTGYPDVAAMPNSTLAEIAADVITSGRGLQYAGTLDGIPALRTEVARFLNGHLCTGIDPSELMITSGAISAADIVCRALTQPGDVVITEDPTFFYNINVFRMSNVEVVSAPMTSEGIDLQAVEALIERYGKRLKMLYTIASYHNPTGINATLENRTRLIELAQTHDFTIVEDSTYQLLYYDDTPPPPMFKQLTKDDHVVALGSFSKLVAPSLRQGWIWATPPQITRFKQFKSDAATSLLSSEILTDYLKSGMLDLHIYDLREFYGRRRASMANALKTYMPDWAEWTNPDGGFFSWITLPERISASKVREATLAQGVDFMPGFQSFVAKVPDRYIRLCFAMLPEAQLEAGVAVIGACLKEMQP